MDMKRQINCLIFLMFTRFLLIQIKFDIDINNDKLWENIWEQKKREKINKIDCVTSSVQQHEAQVISEF
jgi:hypothetical protein